MYKTKDEIMDALGALNWTQVEDEYGDMELNDIDYEISRMFPNDSAYDNWQLAESIYKELN